MHALPPTTPPDAPPASPLRPPPLATRLEAAAAPVPVDVHAAGLGRVAVLALDAAPVF